MKEIKDLFEFLELPEKYSIWTEYFQIHFGYPIQ